MIEPAEREPFRYDREYIVLLSDRILRTERILKNLKKQSDYYNYTSGRSARLFEDVPSTAWAQRSRTG